MPTFTKQGKIKVTLRFDKKFYQQIKIKAILADKTISDYFSDIAMKEIKAHKLKLKGDKI